MLRKFPNSVFLLKLYRFYDPNNVRRHSRFTFQELQVISSGTEDERMLLDLNQHIDYKYFFWGYFDDLPSRLITLMGSSGDILFIDVGANVGLVSIPISVKGYPTISIEPLPQHIEKFKNNLIMNPVADLHLLQFAVGTKEIEGRFRNLKLFSPPGNSGASSADPNWNPSFGPPETYEVPLSTVDELCFKIIPDLSFSEALVKIDVEGMEMDVLLGCQDLVRTYRPVILIEWKPSNKILEKFHQLEHFLKNFSYKLQVIPSEHQTWPSEFNPNAIYENLIIIPEERTIFPSDSF
jgi:FkbM family methyltransferase